MENTRILAWHSPDEVKYYDITTDALLRGAALKILEERMEQGFFNEPRSLERNSAYKRNKQRIFNLELVMGDEDEEAFEDMRNEVENLRGFNKMHEDRFERTKQEWDSIVHCIQEQDGAAAVMLITNRTHFYGEKITLVEVPKYVAEDKESVKAQGQEV